MTNFRSWFALASLGAAVSVHAQWERMGAPGTFSVSLLVAHKDKAYAIIERGLYEGLREGTGRMVFNTVDTVSSGMTAAASWGEDFLTGTGNGRVVVYSDVSIAQRRTQAAVSNQGVNTVAAIGTVLLAGTSQGVHRSADTLKTVVLASTAAGFKGVNELKVALATVYASTDSGLFVSTDSGSTWSRIATPRRKINSIELFDDTLFLATEAGLFRSADAGATWLEPLWPEERFPKLVAQGDRLYAATQTGLWSRAQGEPWSQVQTGLAGQYTGVLELGRSRLLSSYWGIVSSESGDPWIPARPSFTPAAANVQALSNDGANLLAGTENRGTFASTDHGRTWTMKSHPFHYGGVYGVLSNAMLEGSWYSTTQKGIHRSDDSGTSWTLLSSGLPIDFSTYGFHPQGARLWVGTDKGLFFTDDKGDSWNVPPAKPAGQAVYGLVSNRDGTLFAGTDTGLQESSAPFDSWGSNGLLQGTVRPVQRGDTIYASSSEGGPWRSLDGGRSWARVRSGLPGSYLGGIQVGSRHAAAYDGLGGLYVIAHSDTVWQPYNGNLPEAGILAATLLDDTLYVALSFQGVYRRPLPTTTTSTGAPAARHRFAAFWLAPGSRLLRFDQPASITAVSVRDLSGREILQSPSQTGQLSVARLPPGVYTVAVQYRDRSRSTGTIAVP
jgi:photosystem II stability/assembly factor-like uncharacterized protein